MSYASTRRRRDRHLLREMRQLAAQTSVNSWAEFCASINALPARYRLLTAWRVAVGTLR